MTTPAQPPTDGTSADSARSGDDVAQAIEVAERGSSVQEVHDRPAETEPGAAPVEQAVGDPAMTEGQIVGEDDDAGSAASSGAAQSVRGARASDLRAAGEG
jgi:hypothetical protein